MAYVKLPEELRSWEVLLPGGGSSRFEFSIFAGETIGVENRGADGDPPGASLHIRSQRGRRRFDFSRLPIKFQQGDVAGVLAILPEEEDDGPILCVANLDADQRIDFLSREPEVLRLMTREPLDLRRAAIGWSAILGAFVRGLALGGVVTLVVSLALAGVAAGGGEAQSDAGSILAAAGERLTKGGAPLLAGAAAFVLGFGALLTRRALSLGRRARFQRELVDHVWRRAGDALGFVQDHSEAFRFGATIVAAGGSGASEPEEPATRGEDVPSEDALRPPRAAPQDVEDARLLPVAVESEPRAPRRRAPRLPSDWRESEARAAAEMESVRAARCAAEAAARRELERPQAKRRETVAEAAERAARRDAFRQAGQAARRAADREAERRGAAAPNEAVRDAARGAPEQASERRPSETPPRPTTGAETRRVAATEHAQARAETPSERLARLARGLRAEDIPGARGARPAPNADHARRP